jgi:hypothetical protein
VKAKVGDSIIWRECFDDVEVDLHGIVKRIDRNRSKYLVKIKFDNELREVSEEDVRRIE